MHDRSYAMPEEQDLIFDADLIRKYPKSNRKITLEVGRYGIHDSNNSEEKGTSQHISPYGIEFKTSKDFEEGQLLKIQVSLPNYWSRKQQFVNYGRIDAPEQFKILAKVVKTEEVGKRGKKRLVTAQTLIIDEVDEQVLKKYLQEG